MKKERKSHPQSDYFTEHGTLQFTIPLQPITKKNNGRIIIKLTGNGFLYNMVRIISGTLLEVGQGTIKPEEIEKIIQEKDRKKAGKTLPPQGLYLVKVEYA